MVTGELERDGGYRTKNLKISNIVFPILAKGWDYYVYNNKEFSLEDENGYDHLAFRKLSDGVWWWGYTDEDYGGEFGYSPRWRVGKNTPKTITLYLIKKRLGV